MTSSRIIQNSSNLKTINSFCERSCLRDLDDRNLDDCQDLITQTHLVARSVWNWDASKALSITSHAMLFAGADLVTLLIRLFLRSSAWELLNNTYLPCLLMVEISSRSWNAKNNLRMRYQWFSSYSWSVMCRRWWMPSNPWSCRNMQSLLAKLSREAQSASKRLNHGPLESWCAASSRYLNVRQPSCMLLQWRLCSVFFLQ